MSIAIIYPDPSNTGTTTDDYLRNEQYNVSWEVIRNGGGNITHTPDEASFYTNMLIGDFGSVWSFLTRGYVSFDLTPYAGGTVNSVTLSISRHNFTQLTDSGLIVKIGLWTAESSYADLSTADWNNIDTSTTLAQFIPGNFADNAVITLTIPTLTVQSKMGQIIGFGFMVQPDFDAYDNIQIQSFGSNNVYMHSVDGIGELAPKLTIDYTPGVAPSSQIIMII